MGWFLRRAIPLCSFLPNVSHRGGVASGIDEHCDASGKGSGSPAESQLVRNRTALANCLLVHLIDYFVGCLIVGGGAVSEGGKLRNWRRALVLL